ncbi:hypothetical protein BLNAU_16452 [Blattamonas nauphoetae]|uniref:Protein kinase domain-containing protein n=1 Tax=Blattamonas nauphoetae TaxID=2049346 RepID=A0ABQ9XBJ3_9EUKA|nr:hypothetical protein BLNAU_16452 [Blattamonas nauphoetae]
METYLLSSTLVNVSSSSACFPGKQLFGSEVSQVVVGSSVGKSTNHDSGTGMMSPNLGGSLTCLNTSFSSCIRERNAVKTFQNKTYTQGSRLNNVTADVTSVTFTLCTFNTMTIALHQNYGGGAAIYLEYAYSSLTVRTCFFHRCTCTGRNDDGGAVYLYCSTISKHAISISDSSFTECSTLYAPSSSNCGGSVIIVNGSSSVISNCFFELSEADYDGAVYAHSEILTLSNSAFIDCSSTDRTGGVFINQVTTLSLSFLRFRGCSSNWVPDGKDVNFYGAASTQITSAMIQSCDSTSGSPNVYFMADSKANSTLIPQISPTLPVKSIDVSFGETDATVRVSTTKSIEGTMNVLLNGSNVPRLVNVVFGDVSTSSNFGKAVVSSGPNGILPRAEYSFHSAAVNGFQVLVGSFIYTASSTLDGWNRTEIVVCGVSLKEGTYSMLVKNGEKTLNITLYRSDSTTLTGAAPLYPSTADGRLEWGTEYEVTKVMWKPEAELTEEEVTLPESITFTTPTEPPRIEGAKYWLNGKKDMVVVELSGRALSSSGQIVVLSGSSGEISSSGGIFNVTSTKCFVNFSIGLSEDSTHVVFGRKYELLSVGSESSSIPVNSGIFIEVPHPPKITSLTPETEVSSSTFTLFVSGSNLPSDKTFTVTVTSGHSFDISFHSPSTGTSTVKIGGTGEVKYNTEYTIESIIRSEDGKDDEHILFVSSTFKTPLGPTLSSISCEFHSTNGNILNLSLSTARMPLEDFTLTLKTTQSPSKTIQIPFSSSTLSNCFLLLEVYTQTDTLKYGTEYSIAEMSSSSVTAVVSAQPFSTPPEPIRITSAECSLGGVQEKSGVVTLMGVKLGGGKAFNVTVRKLEGSTLIGDEIILSGTLSGGSSSTTHSLSVVIFGTTNCPLSFDAKYLITEFKVDGEVSVVDGEVTFSVPAEPARITGAKCWLNGKKDVLIVELRGSALSSSGRTAVISGSSVDVSSMGGLFNVTSTKCFVNFSIGSSESSTHVVFGGHYVLLSVGSGSSSVIVTPGLVIDVYHPPRITSIVVPKEVTTSNFDLSVSGSNLPSGSTFTVTLSSMHTFEISFSSASAGTSTVKIGGSGQLQYNTEYTIQSIILRDDPKDDEHILYSETTFSTPRGPTLLSISCDFNSSNPDSVKVSFSTERMQLADFKLAVEPVDTPTETVELSITSSDLSSGFVVVKVYKQTGTLKYGTTYRVTKMWSGSVVAVLAKRLFSTPSEPIRITSASCSLGGVQEKSALLALSGVKMGGGNLFSVTVQKMVGSDASGEGIVLSGTLSEDSESTSHTHSVVIFGITNPSLSFDSTYLITEFVVKDSVSAVDDDVTFIVPAEPPRIVGIESKELNSDRTKMIVWLEGRALLSRTGKVSLTNGSTSWESLSDVDVVNNTHCTAEFAVGREATSDQLKYGEEYTLKGSWTESSGFHVEDGITIVVPFPPIISKMEFVFSNTLHTGCFVVLTGRDLIVGESLNVTLNDSLSFIATITSDAEAKSSELRIGWPTTLQHNTKYTITSIEAMDEDDGETLFDSPISNTTGSLLDPFVILVDSGSSDSTLFCGDKARPCHSIEDGWKIVKGVEISSLSMSIIHNTTQKEQVRLLSHHEVVMQSGPSTKPELFVSASSSSLSSEMEEEGMVEVVGGRLWIHQVDVILSDSPSLIFIRMIGGHLTIEMCSLVGSKGNQEKSNIDSSTALCEWDTGIIKLEDATTTITSTHMRQLSQGAINMKGGNLNIQGSIFSVNTPTDSFSFPSLRRNIRCSEGGLLEIGSLTGGDGKADNPHLWLSNKDCVLSGEDVNPNAPFFIPTLSSSSTSTLNKTSQAFDLVMKGSTLIPCSLFLEVFEKKKDGSEGKMVRIGLSEDSTNSFNETQIEVSLPVSSMSGFEKGLEWRGRLLYGLNESTTSFVIQKNSVDRAAQTVKENMKWWIPLLVSLVCLLLLIVIVVMICRHRRKQNKQKSKQRITTQELDGEDEARLELEQKMEETIAGNSVDYLIKSHQTVNPNLIHPDPPTISVPVETQEFVEVLGESGEVGIVDWMKADTLFDVLHRPEKKRAIEKKELSRQMTKGLIRVLGEHPRSRIATRFSPHWVLVNNSIIQLRLGTIHENPLEGQRTQNDNKQGDTVGVEGKGSFFEGRLSAVKGGTTEGQRWRAPEASRLTVEKIDVESALVFSLGLVLWEVWTGEVPWKEMDEANACRQNEGGIQPNLKLVLDTSIRELISKCLSFDPKERPSLQDVFDGLGVSDEKVAEQPLNVAKASDAHDILS